MKWRVLPYCAVAVMALVVAPGCMVEARGGPPVVVHRPGPPVEVRRPGPPPHAPAHGYQRKYYYRYYPSAFVYLDVNRSLYFYLEGGAWQVGVRLPAHIHIDAGEAVSLTLETDRPYVGFDAHRAKYPPRRPREHGGPPEGGGRGRGRGRGR